MGDDFYRYPSCGLIDQKNQWAILAGIHLTFWTPNSITKYQNEEFCCINSIRLKNEKCIEILIDPWSEFSAIWELNLESTKLTKIKEFKKYQGKEFTHTVEW